MSHAEMRDAHQVIEDIAEALGCKPDNEAILERIGRLQTALQPFADIGLACVEKIRALQPLNVPFYDCPEDLVLYNDNMGHTICVGDIRRARNAFYGVNEQEAQEK